jgi:hypothetical protein
VGLTQPDPVLLVKLHDSTNFHLFVVQRHDEPLPREPRAYGQSRGVMPFSCAYLAADASTSGRTSA